MPCPISACREQVPNMEGPAPAKRIKPLGECPSIACNFPVQALHRDDTHVRQIRDCAQRANRKVHTKMGAKTNTNARQLGTHFPVLAYFRQILSSLADGYRLPDSQDASLALDPPH